MRFAMPYVLALVLALAAAVASAQEQRAPNRLQGEASLYLQQHVHNAVDWYPWGEEALAKARAENKPILVSVGYAACHWCHVMAEESFEDEEIGRFVNAHFVPVKIDREQRPDLDEQFVLVTAMLTGSSGWPNTVFLTPDAEPFYGGGYFPRDEFLRLTTTIAQVWREDEFALRADAVTIATRLRDYLDQSAAVAEVDDSEILEAARARLDGLDEFNGGFGTAPKFPRESLLLFLLDQAERHGDDDLQEAVTLTLDGMVRGGIHDHVGGGFHRYAVDPDWQVPHFEKMLYNQALIARILVRAWVATGVDEYRVTAERTLDYVLREMRAPSGGFYAAQDADSPGADGERAEGAYYIWTADQIREALDPTVAQALIAAFGVSDPGGFEGANILSLQALPGQAAAEQGLSAAALTEALGRLAQMRAGRPPPITDQKVILAWNAQMIATLAEAGAVLERPDYLTAAENAMRFALGQMRGADGMLRVHYDGRADTAAQLPDYAALGLALLALHDHSAPQAATIWLGTAGRVADEMQARFADEGLAMRMTERPDGVGPFRPLDDTELPSGNAMALEFLAGLARRTGDAGEEAQALAAVLAGDAMLQPGSRAATLTALSTQRGGDSGPVRFSSGGAVRVQAVPARSQGELHLELSIRDGWHINAHTPLEEYFIATSLVVGDQVVGADVYPAPLIKSLGFNDKPLALYEGDLVLSYPLPERGAGGAPTRVALVLQACSDAICLPPDEIVFHLW